MYVHSKYSVKLKHWNARDEDFRAIPQSLSSYFEQGSQLYSLQFLYYILDFWTPCFCVTRVWGSSSLMRHVWCFGWVGVEEGWAPPSAFMGSVLRKTLRDKAERHRYRDESCSVWLCIICVMSLRSLFCVIFKPIFWSKNNFFSRASWSKHAAQEQLCKKIREIIVYLLLLINILNLKECIIILVIIKIHCNKWIHCKLTAVLARTF